MNADTVLKRLVALVFASGLLLPGVRAAEAATSGTPVQKTNFGTTVAIVRNAVRAPIGGATNTAARADGAAIRATVSGSDGVYSFADVVPGASLTSAAELTNNLGVATTACRGRGSIWFPDLRKTETKLSIGAMLKF